MGRQAGQGVVATPSSRPRVLVLAGVNGAGKSSVAGEVIRATGGEFFNPDEAARRIIAANPGTDVAVANAAAWAVGRRQLERAIAEHRNYAFETTLGGTTITRLLEEALLGGLGVHVRYVGLEGPELHIARVRARVARGGHDIPEAKIRERYDQSRRNLIRLLPRLMSLSVFDNSADAPPERQTPPRPRLLLQMADGIVLETASLQSMPIWAKPIVMAALGEQRRAPSP